MRTGRSGIHLSFAYGAVLITFVHQVLNLLVIAYGDGFSVWNRNFAGKLSNLKILLPLFLFVNQQILQFFHVNFNDSDSYLKREILIFVAFYPLK